jgi:hypothetical protein
MLRLMLAIWFCVMSIHWPLGQIRALHCIAVDSNRPNSPCMSSQGEPLVSPGFGGFDVPANRASAGLAT